jgi:small-conductance mechanosensitive channel
MTISIRSQVLQVAGATLLMVAVLAVGYTALDNQNLWDPKKQFEALVHGGMFLLATGSGLYAVRQGRSLLFRSLDRQAAIIWRNLTSWTLYALVALVMASVANFQLTNFLVGGAILGVVVASAAQSSLSNFFAGLVLMLSRPYRIGTSMRLRSALTAGFEYEGTVMDMNALYTTLRTGSGQVLRLPNNTVVTSAMIIGPPPVQARMGLEVPQGTPLSRLRHAVEERLEMKAGAVVITPVKLAAAQPEETGKLICEVEVRSPRQLDPHLLAEALASAVDSVRPVLR